MDSFKVICKNTEAQQKGKPARRWQCQNRTYRMPKKDGFPESGEVDRVTFAFKTEGLGTYLWLGRESSRSDNQPTVYNMPC